MPKLLAHTLNLVQGAKVLEFLTEVSEVNILCKQAPLELEEGVKSDEQ